MMITNKCCVDQMVRGGKCYNCGQWIEELCVVTNQGGIDMRHHDTNELVAEPIFVVHAHDLRQMSGFMSEVGFNDFTSGDAEHTLVHPNALIGEVEDNNDDDQYAELLEDLEKVKAMGHLIAFDG